ncbi:MAG: hypothetical protein AABY33_04120 [Pseudomonadota bacterium]
MLQKFSFLSLLAICIFSASVLHAENSPNPIKEDPYFMTKEDFMTNKELYEDCKQAIEYADNGEMHSFARTYCISQITGYFTAFDRAGMAAYSVYAPRPIKVGDPAPADDTKQWAHKSKEIMTALNRTFCIPKEWQKKNIYLLIAKEYVKYIEERKDRWIKEGVWENPQPMGFSLSIFAPEECKK